MIPFIIWPSALHHPGCSAQQLFLQDLLRLDSGAVPGATEEWVRENPRAYARGVFQGFLEAGW